MSHEHLMMESHYKTYFEQELHFMCAGFYITGCQGQPVSPVGQSKVHSGCPIGQPIVTSYYTYSVGQQKRLVRLLMFGVGFPTGQFVFKSSVNTVCVFLFHFSIEK